MAYQRNEQHGGNEGNDGGHGGAIARWLGALGFTCDPFAHAFGESDPHLHRYWVRTSGHLSSHQADVLVFGAPGSGKTAKRMRLLDDHRGQPNLLPISLSLPGGRGADASLSDSDLWEALLRAWAQAALIHCLQHGTPQLAQDRTFLRTLGRFLDAWLPLGQWRDQVLEARSADTWPDLLARLDASNIPVRESGMRVAEGAALAEPAGGGLATREGPLDLVVLPAAVTRVMIMADDFDADPRRTARQITDLAARIWAWRRRIRAIASRPRRPEVAVQLFLPVAARSSALRRIKVQREIYDIAWTEANLNELVERRLAYACPQRSVTLDWLLMGGSAKRDALIASAQGSPRVLVELIEDALLERALAAHAPSASPLHPSAREAPSPAASHAIPDSRHRQLA